MLVLTRKKGERIIIDGNIVVEIVDCVGGKVRLGIVAPKNITIDREEITHRKERQDDRAK